MSSNLTCPICGKPLASGAPHGLCPACLLRAGVPTNPPGSTVERRSFVPPTPAELAPHFPQLEILELIGQGGMGVVYQARQPNLDRVVALKILRAHPADHPGFAERFTREAKALARLSHPNIVAVHDFGQAGAFHFLLMEFVDGVNLRHLLTTGKIDAREALAIVPPICDALQYAHDRGIVHRDIKPENILLAKSGAVKIADFGLAKLVGAETRDFSLTGGRDVMGTPHYMAPEQVERPLEVDHRADIYSLGVVFYQMLTGELPLGRFTAPSRKVTIDVRLDEVVLRALEKAPEQRYQQATALKAEVETIATTLAGARGRDTDASPKPSSRTWRYVAGLSGLAALMLVITLKLLTSRSRSPGSGRDPIGHVDSRLSVARDDPIPTATFPPTEFDAMESDPQILRERLQLAEAKVQMVRARFDAGLETNHAVLTAEQKVARFKAKLTGDRVGFVKGDVEVARKYLAEVAARRAAGLETDEAVRTAESELRIAEIRLRKEEARYRAEHPTATEPTARPKS